MLTYKQYFVLNLFKSYDSTVNINKIYDILVGKVGAYNSPGGFLCLWECLFPYLGVSFQGTEGSIQAL